MTRETHLFAMCNCIAIALSLVLSFVSSIRRHGILFLHLLLRFLILIHLFFFGSLNLILLLLLCFLLMVVFVVNCVFCCCYSPCLFGCQLATCFCCIVRMEYCINSTHIHIPITKNI